jgi:hypothetical protein
MLNNLQASVFGRMKESSHAIVTSFCDPRTVLQQVLYRREMPIRGRTKECRHAFSVSDFSRVPKGTLKPLAHRVTLLATRLSRLHRCHASIANFVYVYTTLHQLLDPF